MVDFVFKQQSMNPSQDRQWQLDRKHSVTRALLRLERTMNLLEGGKGSEGKGGEGRGGGEGGERG